MCIKILSLHGYQNLMSDVAIGHPSTVVGLSLSLSKISIIALNQRIKELSLINPSMLIEKLYSSKVANVEQQTKTILGKKYK